MKMVAFKLVKTFATYYLDNRLVLTETSAFDSDDPNRVR